MLDTQKTLDNYGLAKSCARHRAIDPLNRNYLARNKIRQISGSYQRRVVMRRKARTDFDFDLDIVLCLQRSAQDRLFSRLETLTKQRDIDSFVRTLQRVKWENRRSGDFARAIRLALNISAPVAAKHIFILGQKYHPTSPHLAAYAELFGKSPRASIRALPRNSTLEANREWLKENRAIYRGQWIALRDGTLIGVGSSLEDLTSRIKNVSNTLLTRA
jgi:hypothetical protein